MAKRQYIANREVSAIENTDVESLALVRFLDGSFEEYDRKTLETLLSKDPYDLTALRERMLRPVAQIILEVLLRYAVKVEDVEYLNQVVVQSINQSLDRAEGKLYRREGEEARDIHSKTLRDIDRILKG